MREQGIVVAIDGPAGAGKSCTARGVARRLGYIYLDTGAMYRALGLGVIRRGLSPDCGKAAARLARTMRIEFCRRGGQQRTFLDGEDVSTAIRTPEVSDAASRVAVHAEARKALVARQREIGPGGGIVLEGRDTGTVVFPDAELKVFLVADVEERARRRQRESAQPGETADLSVFVDQILDRDRRDKATQLKQGGWPAADSLCVDTTGLSIEEQVGRIVELALERGAQLPVRAGDAP